MPGVVDPGFTSSLGSSSGISRVLDSLVHLFRHHSTPRLLTPSLFTVPHPRIVHCNHARSNFMPDLRKVLHITAESDFRHEIVPVVIKVESSGSSIPRFIVEPRQNVDILGSRVIGVMVDPVLR